ncbi:MAG: hypothetical protein ACRBDX_06670, partial [Gammaproteobacteria bacterium]
MLTLRMHSHLNIFTHINARIFLCICNLFFVSLPLSALAAFPDPLINIATVTAPAGVSDPSGNNSASDSNSLSLPSLAIDKT